MPSKTKTELGMVTIDNEVIARIAGLAAMDCYGIVGMAARSVKDGLVRLLKIETLTRGVVLSINENVLTIRLHIIVEYGTNIPAIANSLTDTVKYKVFEYTGLNVEKIEVFVDGIRVE
ncbi:MAG: Asp23/Gls24 family envelope stress response protein [Defluviitaleaceae bacterium]|nr:Asp23/Gls24 family envelope stress response protein [Defluviitaleaceae bacterium]